MSNDINLFIYEKQMMEIQKVTDVEAKKYLLIHGSLLLIEKTMNNQILKI